MIAEWPGQSEEYYRSAIESGAITIDGEVVTADTTIRPHTKLGHFQHKHEPPCTDKDVLIIFENDDLLVVDKPASYPVHPVGRFNKNSVTALLKLKRPELVLHPINRLDRLTSGIVLFGKNPQIATKIQGILKSRKGISKKYYARVIGQFPHSEIVVDKPLKCLDHVKHIWGVCEEGEGYPSVTRIKLVRADDLTRYFLGLPLDNSIYNQAPPSKTP
eukprot:TRINITY_DN2208_c0_g2_i12.p1 TRINITY_DN2208_c0_g2~~TRINITY_DN2208_c0_g2_i12.p1  ORF type:complete len:217 (+),score=34.40 TRINITY_DN2208_c0_g2_i12:367-1017(+)